MNFASRKCLQSSQKIPNVRLSGAAKRNPESRVVAAESVAANDKQPILASPHIFRKSRSARSSAFIMRPTAISTVSLVQISGGDRIIVS